MILSTALLFTVLQFIHWSGGTYTDINTWVDDEAITATDQFNTGMDGFQMAFAMEASGGPVSETSHIRWIAIHVTNNTEG